jgi:hypothetical protein
MRRLIPLLLVVVLIAAACGGSGDSREASTTLPVPGTSPWTTTAASSTTAPSSTTQAASSTTSPPPSASTTATTPGPELSAGLFCRDLVAMGYGYDVAVEYWMREGQPDRMDADRSGIPCETAYPGTEVRAYWEFPFVVIQASDADPGDGFGHNTMFAEGNLVVASHFGVYVFAPSGGEGEWIETRLVRRDGLADEAYPKGVAADGNRIAVGAFRPNVAEVDFRGTRGVVYVFTKVGADWVEERIEIDSVVVDDNFEVSAIDGDRIVVRSGRGDLIVLDRETAGWSEQRLPTAALATGCPECPVDVSGDTIAVGHPWWLSTFVFTWDGTDWIEEQLSDECGVMFGSSVDVEGERLLVGANGHSPGPGGPACVGLFTRTELGWVFELVAESGEGFGEEIQLTGDLILTIANHSGNASLLVYRKESGAWLGTRVQPDLEWIDALAADRQHCAVSNSGGLRDAGTVYVYEMTALHPG